MEANREQVASALMSLGYEISRSWHFKLRDEKTPSAIITGPSSKYKEGTIHDFGNGWHGDLIEVLKEFHNMSFGDAKAKAEELLGQEIKIDFSDFEKDTTPASDKPLPDHFMVPHRIDAQNNRQAYLHELKLLFEGEYQGKRQVAAKWDKILEVAKKYDIGFNKKSGRLIMPIRDIDGKIRTFWKYKKRGASFIAEDGKEIKHRKVLYTKGRSRPPFAVTDLIEYAKSPSYPILITEGEKDAMVAIANGQRAICIGGAGASKKLDDKYLQLFQGLKVIIAGDYDKAGVAFNQNLLEQLKPVAKSVTILRWEEKAKTDGFELHKKFDLADYFAWKNNFATKKKIKVIVQQIVAKEIEVELNEGENIEDKELSLLYQNGRTIYSKYTIKA